MPTTQAFDDLWEKALHKYFTSTNRTSSEKDLLKQLKTPDDLQKQLEANHNKFSSFRERHGKLTGRLKATVKPFMALSSVASSAVSLSPFAPASTILGAVVFLVKATDGVSEVYDWIEQLFDKLGDFTIRLDEYVNSGISAHLETKVVQILGCLLEILARSEKTIKDGRWKKYAAVLFLGKDEEVKASFEDLAKLFEDEQRLVSAITFATNQTMNKRIEEIEKTGKQMLEAVQRAEIGVNATQQGQFRDKILNWISSIDFPAQQSDMISQRQKETGQWFHDAPEFNSWISGSKQTLFCPGMPGAGKTMMAAMVIDHLSRTIQNDTNGVAYVYCSYKMRADQNTTILLAAILRQLVQAQRSIPEPVSRLHEHHSSRGTRPSLEEIFSVLQSILRDYSSVYLVVDALDESLGKDYTHSQLLTRVRDLQKEANLHLMVTSRFIPEIEEEIKEKFKQATRLEVRASNEDVERYIMGQMYRLPKWIRRDDELQGLVQDKIVEAADGMFLLARLYVDSLQNISTKKKVRSALEKISKRFRGTEELVQVYDQAYEKVIERIESQPPEKSALARRVLSWITHAQRQLTIKELCHALAVVLDDEDLDEVDEDNIPDVEDIVSVCAGLVTIDEESNIIRLVHYTTQEYFERIREKWNPRAELEIASACLTYLSFHPFRSGSCPSDEEFESRLEHNAFLDYASRYWGQHARTVQEQVFEVASRFLQDDNLVSCAIQTMEISKYKYLHGYSQYFPRQVTSVHLAATFGLLYLLERLLLQPSGSIVISADSKDNYGLTPLSWAAWNGHEAVVKLLLEKGAQLESKDENGRTPLSWAAGNGHVTVVKLLVENGAQLESKDENGLPPLSYAAKRGHKAVVKLLVENGAHLESKDVNGQTPLSYASRSGHVTVVKLLVENGAQLESKDKYGWIPMWYAARNGHEAVVKLLLENDAQLESKDKNGQTPLSHDAGSRHEAVVKLLLENGADNS